MLSINLQVLLIKIKERVVLNDLYNGRQLLVHIRTYFNGFFMLKKLISY